jgi:hypothetical protein
MVKIAISTPAYGEIFYTSYVESVLRLTRALEQRRWSYHFSSLSYADIVESRNYLITHWYDKTNATHLLFVDADMGFDAQLVLDMVALDEPVVGVVAPKRQIDLDKLAKLSAEGQPIDKAKAGAHTFIVHRKPGVKTSKSGFIEVNACGTGIMLVKRDCLTKMLSAMPELSDSKAAKTSPLATDLSRLIRAFDPLVVDGSRLSEDFSFCHRWRQCDGQIWASVAHPITHVGLHRFKARYSDRAPTRVVVSQPPRPGGARSVTGRVRRPDS